jgi:hypothetical protein
MIVQILSAQEVSHGSVKRLIYHGGMWMVWDLFGWQIWEVVIRLCV